MNHEQPVDTGFTLYEIAISIGNSLNLDVNLKEALTSQLRHMNGVGIAVFSTKQQQVIHQIPKRNFIHKFQHCFDPSLFEQDTHLMSYKIMDGNHCYVFELPDSGYLLLVKKQPLTEAFIKMLRPICVKLDTSIQACYANSEIQLKERELNQALIKLNAAKEAKDRFLANMSHEIRTPLNGIMGFIEQLHDTPINDQQKSYLDIVSSSSETLMGIINDILDFSKVESGKLEVEHHPFELNSTIFPAVSILKSRASEKNLLLDIQIEATDALFVSSDALRLKQVLTNLTSNAIKFTPTGQVTVLTELLESDEKTVRIRFSVKDTGIGIPQSRLQAIFDPFSQVDASITRKFGGTGLGLAISSQLVELLGGQLQVNSVEGKGTEFYFTLALEKTSAPLPSARTENIASVDLSNKRILVAEDNHVNQLLMKAFLSKLKITFDIVDDGEAALEAYQQNRYDLVLMDINMPKMGGLEALEAIKQRQRTQQLYSVPIIAVTANALKGDHETYILQGMAGCLTKPIKLETLAKILQKHLS